MTIVEALHNLAKAFGGTSDSKTASEAIEDVASAVEAGGGGGGLVLTFSENEEHNKLLLSETYATIRNAFESGVAVVLVDNLTDGQLYILSLIEIHQEDESGELVEAGVKFSSGDVYYAYAEDEHPYQEL